MFDDFDEYQTLQQILEGDNLFQANNVYNPLMKIDEMRTLCAALEEPGSPVQSRINVQPEVGREAVPDNDTIDIVKQLFENHKTYLQRLKPECAVSVPEPPAATDEANILLEQKKSQLVERTATENNADQAQTGGNGRRLRNRVPRNYGNQEPRKQTRRQRKLEDEEHRKLRRFLQERDLYKPPMDIEEMRAVCQAIEQSMQDMTLKRCEPEFEDWTYLVDHRPLQEPLREENLQMPNDLNPIFVDDIFGSGHQAVSPPTVPSPAVKYHKLLESPPEWSPPAINSPVMTLSVPPNVDSDSETEYSPDNPGPCCKVIHVVHVEVHPEPREDPSTDESAQKACAKLNSSLLSRSVPTDAWDAIDEFF
uniref:Uncharacterized protein n=1 Tax=Culex tarsalis TaxID=7177 RepID=A0A1Q3F3L2_CULTA